MLLIRRCSSSYHKISTIRQSKKVGDKLGVQGWVQNIRRLKNNIFLDIQDGSTSHRFQVVVPRTENAKKITTGSSIFANGHVQVAPNGQFELHADEFQLLAHGQVTSGYPFISKQQHSPEYVREHLHLRSRVDYIASQLRVRHRAQKVIHDFMDQEGFVHIHTPIMTTNDCEGAGEVFTVHPESAALLKEMSRPNVPRDQSYFNSKVFLSVSGQLHLEAMSYGLGNTYTISPAFRAENCRSTLHLAEFYMFEAEVAFMESLPQLTEFIERLLKEVTSKIVDANSEDLHHCQLRSQGKSLDLPWLHNAWKTLTYGEALDIVERHRHQFKTEVKPTEGFSKEQEFFLVDHCQSPVFVVDWPAAQKPFYMRASRTNPEIVHALDLLMPSVGELCGGSLREPDVERLRQHPQLPAGLDWYLELRQFGGIPTGGFGMGFERYLQLLTGVKNIRDVIPFPRYPHSCIM